MQKKLPLTFFIKITFVIAMKLTMRLFVHILDNFKI